MAATGTSLEPSERAELGHSRIVAVVPPELRPLRDRRLSGRHRSEKALSRDVRSESQRDVDRITYAAEWRRLSGVTQVITALDSDAADLHSRMTHSEKVAQVARSIADRMLNDKQGSETRHDLIARLGGLDASVCEAAALAHDLGHPPFGHVGEMTLDSIALRSKVDSEGRRGLDLEDGFEGNAQSIRIVTIGKSRSLHYEGLDLTCATLSAIAKYPWSRIERQPKPADHEEFLKNDSQYRREWKKFNFYRSEAPILPLIREFTGVAEKVQTLEASVMDVADDISYAVHDLEDFVINGMLNLPRVAAELEDYRVALRNEQKTSGENPFYRAHQRLSRDYPHWDAELASAAVGRVQQNLKDDFTIDLDLSGSIARVREGASRLVGEFIDDVKIGEEPLWAGGPHIGLGAERWHEVQLLKTITSSYVISRPDMALHQRGLQSVLEGVVSSLLAWVEDESDVARLPARLRHEFRLAEKQERATLGGEIEDPVNHGGGDAPRGQPTRAILDYVCGLTDHQCLDLFQKLSGTSVHTLGGRRL